MTRSYYRKKDGVILAYDISKIVSFYNAQLWLKEVNDEAPVDIVKMLVGTKMDLGDGTL